MHTVQYDGSLVGDMLYIGVRFRVRSNEKKQSVIALMNYFMLISNILRQTIRLVNENRDRRLSGLC